MKIQENAELFDESQQVVLGAITAEVHEALIEAGITDSPLLKSLVTDIAFRISVVLDGSAMIYNSNEQQVIPMLGFATSDERLEVVLSPSGSFMHEYAHDLVEEYFDEAGI